MSWYTVDTRMSGGSVRVILKATLLPPVPCHTASEDGSPPCKRAHEVPQSWSDLISIPTAPGSELGVGHPFRNEGLGASQPPLLLLIVSQLGEEAGKSLQIQGANHGVAGRAPTGAARELCIPAQHSERRTQSTVPCSWAAGHRDCVAESHELAALSGAVGVQPWGVCAQPR